MERYRPTPELIDKQKRHQDNLQILHGVYYKGTYYHHGVGQSKKDQKEELSSDVWRNFTDSPR